MIDRTEANSLIQRTEALLDKMLTGDIVFTGTAAEEIRRLAVQLDEHIQYARRNESLPRAAFDARVGLENAG